jgi:hypothetical protein
VTFTADGTGRQFAVSQDGVADDHGNTPEAATRWDLAGSPVASGVLEVGPDVDVFSFEAPVSGTYKFTSAGTGNVSGYLYDASGKQIAYNLDSGPGSDFLVSHALTGGDGYFLAVRNSNQSASNSNTGAYTVAAEVPQAAVVSVSAADWAAPQTGGSSEVVVTTNRGSWSGVSSESWLTLSPRSGSSGRSAVLTAAFNASTEARSATVVFTADGARAAVTVSQAGVVDDHGNTAQAATRWDLAAAAAGSLEVGPDVDVFCFEAPVSGTYKFTSAGTGNVSGYLYDASGAQIAYNLDSGPGSDFLVSHALTGGQGYCLAVRNSNQSASNRNTGPYTVTAAVPAGSWVSASASGWAAPQTGGALTVAVATSGQSWSGSSDASWVTLSPRSGSPGRQAVLTAALNPTPQPRTATVTFTSDGARASVTVHQPGAVDDHGNTPAAATEWDLAAAPAASGVLETGPDVDVFTFTAPATGTYKLTSDATGNVSGYLYDQAGKQIAYNLDSGPGLNFQITRTLTAGETYHLAIRNSNQTQTNTNTGPYTITATHT